MMAATAASSSCCGRYSCRIASSARSTSSSSGRPASWYAAAASRRFLASRASTLRTSCELSSRCAPALSSTVIAVKAIRKVPARTLSWARMAPVRSDCRLAFVTVIPTSLSGPGPCEREHAASARGGTLVGCTGSHGP